MHFSSSTGMADRIATRSTGTRSLRSATSRPLRLPGTNGTLSATSCSELPPMAAPRLRRRLQPLQSPEPSARPVRYPMLSFIRRLVTNQGQLRRLLHLRRRPRASKLLPRRTIWTMGSCLEARAPWDSSKMSPRATTTAISWSRPFVLQLIARL